MVEFTGALSDIAVEFLSSPLAGVFASVISAVTVYSVRQIWEKYKLKISLLTEIKQMDGIQKCADQLNRVEKPPNRSIKQDDMPSANSVPTVVYEKSAINLGLLSGPWTLLQGKAELENAVDFYSDVLYYKGIMERINNGDEVSENDQVELYESIGEIAIRRKRIINNKEFVSSSNT